MDGAIGLVSQSQKLRRVSSSGIHFVRHEWDRSGSGRSCVDHWPRGFVDSVFTGFGNRTCLAPSALERGRDDLCQISTVGVLATGDRGRLNYVLVVLLIGDHHTSSAVDAGGDPCALVVCRDILLCPAKPAAGSRGLAQRRRTEPPIEVASPHIILGSCDFGAGFDEHRTRVRLGPESALPYP